MSNYFVSMLGNVSILSTIYTICALGVIYQYFDNEKKYFILAIIFGVLFDVIYTSTFPLNTILFLVVALFVKIINNVLSNNIFMNNLVNILSIILYHLFLFIILSVTSYGNYNIMLLVNIILGSIVMTIIYTSVSYILLKFIFDKLELKQVK